MVCECSVNFLPLIGLSLYPENDILGWVLWQTLFDRIIGSMANDEGCQIICHFSLAAALKARRETSLHLPPSLGEQGVEEAQSTPNAQGVALEIVGCKLSLSTLIQWVLHCLSQANSRNMGPACKNCLLSVSANCQC